MLMKHSIEILQAAAYVDRWIGKFEPASFHSSFRLATYPVRMAQLNIYIIKLIEITHLV